MRKFNQEELVEKIRSERRHMTELYDEINQLKQENANLKEYVKSLKDECISCPENKKNVKQAKIDVLNKLKEKYGFYSCYAWGSVVKSLSEIIDELIKEIEEQ